MKKLILLLASVAILLVGALTTMAVMQRYDEYKLSQTTKAQAETARHIDRLNQLRNDLEAEKTAALDTLRAECEKGVTAYNALTLANKQKIAAPTCGQ